MSKSITNEGGDEYNLNMIYNTTNTILTETPPAL